MKISSLSLSELNAQLQDAIDIAFPDTVWVRGELSEARCGSGGHFYGELIEKDGLGQNVLARARVTCWARVFGMVNLRFRTETGSEIRSGMSVMMQVRVTFHPVFGLSLNVLDIDSTYTIGSMARRRKEILAMLEKDGILHDNQALELPLCANRIAVVSAATAAGYGDFCHHLQHNAYGLEFTTHLFPALMQGVNVETSVIQALMAIAEMHNQWDAVVIIRGGGATADLSDFDSYPLAACIAQFSIPVIVGIGHERDETVLDHVAYKAVKTPTAAADFFITHQLAQLQALAQFSNRIDEAVRSILLREQRAIDQACRRIQVAGQNIVAQKRQRLEQLSARMPSFVTIQLEREKHRLELLAQKVAQANPERILRLGYSLTMVNGHVVSDSAKVKAGDIIETHLAHGRIVSICQSIEPPKE